eukprot:scaffold1442_cov128-Cylindrotheca_fusiformis.AAC.17
MKISLHKTSATMFDESNYVQFPWKLHKLLDEADSNGLSAIISWLPTGNAFQVHDKKEFAEVVMPKYFQSNKYKSFQRNLNLWCFQTLTKDPNKGAIFHPYFIRGDTDRCHLMKRIKVKKNSMSQKISLAELKASSTPSLQESPSLKSSTNSMTSSDSALSFGAPHLALLASAASQNQEQNNHQQNLMQLLSAPQMQKSPMAQSNNEQAADLQALLNSLLLSQLTGGNTNSSSNQAQNHSLGLGSSEDQLKFQVGLALIASAGSGMQLGSNFLSNAGLQQLNPSGGNFDFSATPMSLKREAKE